MSIEKALAMVDAWPAKGAWVTRQGVREMVAVIEEGLIKRDAEVAEEARTLARAEVIAETGTMREKLLYIRKTLDHARRGQFGHLRQWAAADIASLDDVLAALSRLGEG